MATDTDHECFEKWTVYSSKDEDIEYEYLKTYCPNCDTIRKYKLAKTMSPPTNWKEN